MTKNNVKKAIAITGTILLIAVFTNVITTINTSVNTFNGTSCVVSAFAG